MTERKPIVPLTLESRTRIAALQAWVLLKKDPGANAYQGYVERSWDMTWDTGNVRIWTETWSSEELVAKDLEEKRQKYPSSIIEMYEVHDENLPIIIDIEAWLDAQAHDPNTLAGVTDKYAARNAPFKMKGEVDG